MRILLVWILFCLFSFMKALENSDKPLIIAHRGASYDAPENTLSSVKLAWEQMADAVELDIHLSADNRVMVVHDDDTKRTTGINHNVALTSSDTLRMLDAGSWKNEQFKGEKIPFLEEILETIPPGKKLVIEIKTDKRIVPFLKNILDYSGKKSQCIIISFDFEALYAARSVMPDVPAYLLMDKVEVNSLDSLATRLNANDINGLDLNYHTISSQLIAYCKLQGIPVLAWTVDNNEIAKSLIAMGVLGVTTNRPKEMREALGLY